MFILRFLKYKTFVSRRRPYFTPLRAEVTISFEKLTDEQSYKFEEKILILF